MRQDADARRHGARYHRAGGRSPSARAGGALRSWLLLSTALTALPALAWAQPAPTARPTGGQVVAGQAAIGQTQARTTVTQSSDRAAVNWQSFDVGSAHTVQFAQPNASSVTLNRVTGPNPSEIAGRIQANGQVVIVNQAGVLFHKGAQIDTAGLVATASGISNGNFMAGKMVFDQPANPGARVENRGTITVRERGLAALVAPQVANSGVIRANMGTVVLAGAEAHTLDLYGDGMVAINVTRQVRSAPDGTRALVTNTGTIEARGGTVVLTAEAVDGVVQTLVNADGTVQAGGGKGRVVATGRGGDVVVTGTLAADGVAPGDTGGTVLVTSTGRVGLGEAARISASGPAGGGTVAIGTTVERAKAGPALTGQPMARSVLVSRGATIVADATRTGQGGIVTILSADVTRMEGAISARGVSRGGVVEISGGRVSSLGGQVDVTATAGPVGTILIDPDFLDIVAGASGTGSQDTVFIGAGGTIVAIDPSIAPDMLSADVLNGFAGNVLLQANQTISVRGAVSLTNTAGQSLVLQAGGTINVDPAIKLTVAGDVTLATGGAGPAGAPPARAAPLIDIRGSVISNTGTVSLLAGTNGTITVDGVVAGPVVVLDGPAGIRQTGVSAIGQAGGTIIARTQGGGFIQAASATLVAAALTAPDGVVGSVSLSGTRNAVASVGSFTVGGTGNSFTLIDTGNVTINGPLVAPHNIGIATSGTGRVTVAGTLSNTTGALAIISGTGGIVLTGAANVATFRTGLTGRGPISMLSGARLGMPGSFVDITTSLGGVTQEFGAIINTGTLRSTAGITGSARFLGANTIGVLGDMAVTGVELALLNTGSLSVVGTLTATENVALTSGTIDLTGRIAAPTANVSLIATSGSLGQAGVIQAGPVAVLTAATGITHSGTTTAVDTGAEVRLTTSGGDILNTGSIGADGGVSLTANAPGQTVRQQGTIVAGGTLTMAGDDITMTTGLAHGGLGVTLQAGGAISVTGGMILRTHATDTGAVLLASTGTGTADGIVVGSAVTIANQGVGGPVTIQSKGAVELGGTVIALGASTGTVTIGGGGVSLLTSSQIDAGHSVSITATGAGASILSAGSIAAGAGDSLILAAAGVTQAAGSITSAGNLSIIAGLSGSGGVDVTGAISAQGSLGIAALGGSIALNTGAVVTAPAIELAATGSIAMGPAVRVGQAGASVDLSAEAGITQEASGTLTAATLLSSGGAGGAVTLIGSANAVGTIAAFDVRNGGFRLTTTGATTIDGPLTATGSVSVHADGIGVGGSIGAGSTIDLLTRTGSIALNTGALVTAPSIALDAASGMTIAAGATLGQAGTELLLTAAGGGVTQDSAGVIQAATLVGSVVGVAQLAGISNDVGTLAGFVVSGGASAFLLADSGDLRVTAPVAAPGSVEFRQTGAGTLTADSVIEAGGFMQVTAGSGGLVLTGAGTLTAPTITIRSVGLLDMRAGAELGRISGTVDLGTGGVAQDQAARLLAATLSSGTGITGDASLSGTLNAIGTLGAMAVTGALDLRNAQGLAIAGPVTATGTAAIRADGSIAIGSAATLTANGLTLAANGALTLASGAVVGRAGQDMVIGVASGGVTQDAGATILARQLTSQGTIAGGATLVGTANAIGTIGPFAVGGAGAELRVVDAAALTVAGPLSAPGAVRLRANGLSVDSGITAGGTVALSSDAGLALNAGAVVGAASLALQSSGDMTFAPGATLGQAGAVVDLASTAGAILQDPGATLIAATLRSAAGTFGSVDLGGTANAIATLGGFAVSAGSLALETTTPLTVTGPVTASGDIGLRSAQSVGIEGSVIATGSLAVAALSGGITLAAGSVTEGNAIALSASGPIAMLAGASLGRAGASIDLATGRGGVTQDTTALITAGTLTSLSGIGGDLSLVGQNTIATIGTLGVAGAVVLHDQAALGITGPLSAGGDAYLRVAAADGITIAAGGGVTSGGASRATFHAAAMTIQAGGTVTTGDFEFGVLATGTTLTLGTGVGGLNTLAGVSANLATIGAVTPPGSGLTTTAGSIVVAGPFDGNNLPLRLLSLGGIEGTAAPMTGVASLTGSAGGPVRLTHAGNAIAALTGFSASGADADLLLATTTGLAVTGPVGATRDIALLAGGTVALTGSITAGRSLSAGSGGAMEIADAVVAAPTVIAVSGGPLLLGDAALIGLAGGVVDLSATGGGISQALSGRITAARLRSGSGVAGDLVLTSPDNTIGTIGAIAATGHVQVDSLGDGRIEGPVTAGGDARLRYAGGLTVAGTVDALGTVALAALGTMTVAGGGAVTGATVLLDANGAIGLNDGSVIGRAGAAVGVTSTEAAITQGTGGTLLGGVVRASARDSILLVGSANAFGTLAAVSSAQGLISVNDTLPLRVEGPVTAPAAVALTAPTLTVAGAIGSGTTVTVSALTGGVALTGAGAIVAPLVRMAAAGAVTLDDGALIGQAGGTIQVSTSAGGITQAAGARLLAALLESPSGITGDVDLAGTANAIARLGGVTVSAGGFRLVDTAVPLTIDGPVSGNGITLVAAGVTIPGRVTALSGDVVLGTAALSVSGTVSATGAMAITASGSVSNTGVLLAGGAIDLTGSLGLSNGGLIDAGGSLAATLGGALGNTGTIRSLAGMTLGVGGGLTNDGTVDAGGALGVTAGGSLANAGTIHSALAMSLGVGAGLTNGGTVDAGGSLVVTVAGTLGNVGTILAGGGMSLGTSLGLTNDGLIDAGRSLDATIGGALANTGTIRSVSDMTLGVGAGMTSSRLIDAGGSLSATVGGALGNGGTIQSALGMTLGVTQGLTNDGLIGSGGSLAATVGDALGNTGTVRSATAMTLGVTQALSNSGRIDTDGSLSATVGGALGNTGTIQSATAMTLGVSQGLSNDGVIGAGGSVAATIGGALGNTGTIQSVSAMTLGVSQGLTNDGVIDAGGSLAATVGGALGNTGTIQSVAAMTLGVSQGLSNDGAINAGGSLAATIGGALGNTGTIQSTSAMTLGVTQSLTNNGRIDAGGSLAATIGAAFGNSGTILAAGALSASAGGSFTVSGVVQSGGDTTLLVGGAATVSGLVTAAGRLGLDAEGPITVSGTIGSGSTMTLDFAAAMTLSGALFAPTAPVTLIGASIASSGTVRAGTGGLTATAQGDLTQSAGRWESAGTLAITAGATLSQSGGTLIGLGATPVTLAAMTIVQAAQGTIQAGSAGGSVTITAATINQSGTIIAADPAVGRIAFVAGGTAADGFPLTLNGVVTAGFALTGTASAGGISLGGQIDTGTGGALFTFAGDFRQTAGRLSVPLDWSLAAPGAFTQQSGSILVGGTVAVSALSGDVTLGGTIQGNAVSFLVPVGNWTQSSGLVQSRLTPFALSIPRQITQGPGGTIIAPGSISLAATTGLTQGGTLTVPFGTAPSGLASLSTVTGLLATSGRITAGQVRFTNPAGQISIDGVIDGLTPAALINDSQFAVRAADFPTPAGQAGVFVTTDPATTGQSITFNADVSSTQGRGQVLITIPNDTPLSIAMDSRNADLYLSLQTGTASGTLHVGSLHLRYAGRGSADTVDLIGTVNGLSGYTAASAAFILPSLLPNYQLNGCAIQSVACFQITDLRVPVSNPLADIQTGSTGSQGTSQYILPDVAERDY